MKTELIMVGKTTNKHFSVCIDDYVGRISHYMPFTLTVIPELKNTKKLSEEQQKQLEGEWFCWMNMATSSGALN